MKKAYLVAGLGYGDEGKGSTVDFLVRLCKPSKEHPCLVVRYNGGPQAAHNVVSPTGLHHTFSNFGSGGLVPHAWTYLSSFVLVNPANMWRENFVLQDKGIQRPLDKMIVSAHSLIITPFHVLLNRSLALSSGFRNTTGQGVGQTREDELLYGDKMLRVGDLENDGVVRDKLHFMQQECYRRAPHHHPDFTDAKKLADTAKLYQLWFKAVAILRHDMVAIDFFDSVIFEGAQGVLLDETHGEPGFNTWSDCTFKNAEALIAEARFDGWKHRLGVLRTYHTRHGDGPLPGEYPNGKYPEPHNGNEGYQGRFRMGPLNSKLVDHALKIIGGVDSIALNHMDVTSPPPMLMGAPVSIIGKGPRAVDRKIKLNLERSTT